MKRVSEKRTHGATDFYLTTFGFIPSPSAPLHWLYEHIKNNFKILLITFNLAEDHLHCVKSVMESNKEHSVKYFPYCRLSFDIFNKNFLIYFLFLHMELLNLSKKSPFSLGLKV